MGPSRVRDGDGSAEKAGITWDSDGGCERWGGGSGGTRALVAPRWRSGSIRWGFQGSPVAASAPWGFDATEPLAVLVSIAGGEGGGHAGSHTITAFRSGSM